MRNEGKEILFMAKNAMNQIEKQPIENIIENNNRYFTEWNNRLMEEAAKIRKVREDRDIRGIVPDPVFVQELRDRLVDAGIISKHGGLTEPYLREEL